MLQLEKSFYYYNLAWTHQQQPTHHQECVVVSIEKRDGIGFENSSQLIANTKRKHQSR